MNANHDFDRIAQAWLAEGPEQLPDRVLDAVVDEIHQTRQRQPLRMPWRNLQMNQMTRALAGIAVVAVLIVGGAILLQPGTSPTTGGGPSPSLASPTASASSEVVVPPPAATFVSTLNGYSVKIPADWTTKQASGAWNAGTMPGWGKPEVDELRGSTVRFVGTSQPIAPAQSGDAWIQAYVDRVPACVGDGKTPERVQVGDLFLGTVDQNGCPVGTGNGSVSANGRLFDIVVVAGGRGYNFTMDGDVDHAAFLAMLATVGFDPATAFAASPLPLDQTFTSPWNGYSIGYADGWLVSPATTHWVGWDNSVPAVDELTPAGTDTYLGIGSQPLPSGTTYDQWVADYHSHITPQVPVGCDGGEPGTWPAIPIGAEVGHLEQLCNAAEAIIEVGGRAYVFSWMNTTFTVSSHFGEESFKSMLKTVTFDPASAVD